MVCGVAVGCGVAVVLQVVCGVAVVCGVEVALQWLEHHKLKAVFR